MKRIVGIQLEQLKEVGGSYIVGIDPSINNIGYAYLSPTGELIQYRKLRIKADNFADSIEEIAKHSISLEWQPNTAVFLEMPPFFIREQRNTVSVMKLTAATYAFYGSIAARGFSVFLVPVNQWKGKKSKADVLLYVNSRFFNETRKDRWKITSDHIADAAGLAAWAFDQIQQSKRQPNGCATDNRHSVR